MDLFDLYQEYGSEKFDLTTVPANPISLFQKWYSEAQEVDIYEPSAFSLATADKNGSPDVRMLLLKEFGDEGFTFFTNYDSTKGKHLYDNPQAAMVFYWSALDRQVRITGTVERLDDADSDKYFETRPDDSKLGAWVSPQSIEIESREWLEAKHSEFKQQFKNKEIPRPKNWGGYKLVHETIEFWQGRPDRLHDRIEYYRDGDDWGKRRLAP